MRKRVKPPRCRCALNLRPDGTCPAGCPKKQPRHVAQTGQDRRYGRAT